MEHFSYTSGCGTHIQKCLKQDLTWDIDKQFQFDSNVMLFKIAIPLIQLFKLKTILYALLLVLSNHNICNCGFRSILNLAVVPCSYLLRYVCVQYCLMLYNDTVKNDHTQLIYLQCLVFRYQNASTCMAVVVITNSRHDLTINVHQRNQPSKAKLVLYMLFLRFI